MKTKQNTLMIVVLIFLTSLGIHQSVKAHCEMPCGIYADSLRIVMISEDITTIEKSMSEIIELSKATPVNYNQLVRWVTTKEEHANKIQDIATQYFMFQRVKLTTDKNEMIKNQKLLGLLHEICVYAMKCKQTTDLEWTKKLTDSLNSFSKLYFENAEHSHH